MLLIQTAGLGCIIGGCALMAKASCHSRHSAQSSCFTWTNVCPAQIRPADCARQTYTADIQRIVLCHIYVEWNRVIRNASRTTSQKHFPDSALQDIFSPDGRVKVGDTGANSAACLVYRLHIPFRFPTMGSG